MNKTDRDIIIKSLNHILTDVNVLGCDFGDKTKNNEFSAEDLKPLKRVIGKIINAIYDYLGDELGEEMPKLPKSSAGYQQ